MIKLTNLIPVLYSANADAPLSWEEFENFEVSGLKDCNCKCNMIIV